MRPAPGRGSNGMSCGQPTGTSLVPWFMSETSGTRCRRSTAARPASRPPSWSSRTQGIAEHVAPLETDVSRTS